VVLFSRRFGRLALVDKGGRSLKARRGRILAYHLLEITFYSSRKGGGYVSDCVSLETFDFAPDGQLGRLAYAAAACELLNLLLPEEEPQEDLYGFFVTYLRIISRSPRLGLPAVFLAFYLRLLSLLGYHPSLGWCIGCGNEIDPEEYERHLFFSPERGGLVCLSCQRPGEQYISLSKRGWEQLMTLQTSSLADAAAHQVGYGDAVILAEALTKFLQFHAGVGSALKSLTFLEKLKQTDLR